MPVASNPVFPSLPGLIALPATRTVMWYSLRPPLTVAGVDVSQGAWTYPRYQYKLSAAYLRTNLAFAEFQTLLGFFNIVNGSNSVWQFDDAFDRAVTDQVFAVGDGVRTAFQLVRTLGAFVEPVFAPNVVTNVKVNGVIQTPVTAYTVSNKGVVNFTSPPANASSITWTGTYLWFCRFDSDMLEFTQLTAVDRQNSYGAWFAAQGLSFTTQKFGS